MGGRSEKQKSSCFHLGVGKPDFGVPCGTAVNRPTRAFAEVRRARLR